jgi:hypothetical protein
MWTFGIFLTGIWNSNFPVPSLLHIPIFRLGYTGPHKMSLTVYRTLQPKHAYIPRFPLQLYGFFPRSSSSPYTKNSPCVAEIWIRSMFPLHFISVPAITTILFCTTLYISCIFIEPRYIPRKAICTASKHLTPSSEFFHENLAVANPFNQHLYFMQFEATQQYGVCLAEPEKPSTHKHTHYFLIYCMYNTGSLEG